MSQVVVVSEAASDPTRLWHQFLGHMSEKELKLLMDHKLLPSMKFLNFNFCKHSMFGKHARMKFKARMHVSKGILDYIHSDVWGPSPTVSYGGSPYFVTFIDDYSGKVWVYLIKIEVDVFNVFK